MTMVPTASAEEACDMAAVRRSWKRRRIRRQQVHQIGLERSMGIHGNRRSHGGEIKKQRKHPARRHRGRCQDRLSLTDGGKAGPGREGEITEVTATSCTFVEAGSCEASKPVSMKAIHLPWKTKLSEPASGEIRNTLTEGTSGAPGWVVECTVAGIFKTADECTGVTSTLTRNGAEGTVEAEFEKNSAKATCSIGGKESGRIEGIDAIEKAGGGLAVFKLVPGVYIRPAVHKFKKVTDTFTFKIWNFSNAGEEVESGKINPNEKAFKVTGGAACFNKKIYVADPNKAFTCPVTIEELEAGKKSKFEIKPKSFRSEKRNWRHELIKRGPNRDAG